MVNKSSIVNSSFVTRNDVSRQRIERNVCRAVEQGGVTFAEEKVTDVKSLYDKAAFADGVMVRKGKKSFKKVTF